MINELNIKMLKLLSDVLHNRTPDKIVAEQWDAIYKELHIQMVYALPGEYIFQLGLNEKDTNDYLNALIHNRQIFHKVMKEQKYALNLLYKENIPVVVLKGASAAINYAHPENRCMGDIDLLVMPNDFDRAYNLLTSSGCTPINISSNYDRHIGMFTPNGVEIELHRYFSSSDNDSQNAILDEIIFKAIPNAVYSAICGYPTMMLPPLENGLVLLGHINQHLSGGLGLRQIIDWMEYVEKYLDDDMWNNEFEKAAQQIGMKKLAIVTTAMCQKYLGLEKNIHWCTYETVCDELMEYILSNGNFGIKENSFKRKTVSVLKQFQNPLHGLARAQRNGLINWQASKKYPILKPFAWCYQLIRWTKKGIIGGITPSKLSDANSSAKKGAELMEKLGVTRL